MTLRRMVVAALVRLYPATWRREYGNELTAVIAARRLSLSVLADVAANGLRQRLRSCQPSTIVGLIAMSLFLEGVVLTPNSYTGTGSGAIRLSGKAVSAFEVTFLPAEVYAILLVFCGCWVELRRNRTLHRCGLAAMRMSIIAAIPVILCGCLIAGGMLDLTFTWPAPVTHNPVPFAMVSAVVLRLPEAWLWGVLGGQVGRWIRSETSAAA